jgi:hypothetical protein
VRGNFGWLSQNVPPTRKLAMAATHAAISSTENTGEDPFVFWTNGSDREPGNGGTEKSDLALTVGHQRFSPVDDAVEDCTVTFSRCSAAATGISTIVKVVCEKFKPTRVRHMCHSFCRSALAPFEQAFIGPSRRIAAN